MSDGFEGARLTIDLGAIADNWSALAQRVAPAECAAVVKADAYGLGAREVSAALWNAGARTFFVAHLAEALVVRDVLPDAVIYVLNGLAPGASTRFRESRIRPVLGSLAEIEEWAAQISDENSGEAAIHIDTGMNRLGLDFSGALEVAERRSAGRLGFRPSLLMSHLACADEPGHSLTARQVDVFARAARLFPGVAASLANSAATLSIPESWFDLCRPGIALYGSNPIPSEHNPMRPVVRLAGRIVQVRAVDGGESVGYGAAQTMQRPSRIAIVSVGYADGFLRAGGSCDDREGTFALVGGQPCPLVGRISMDLLAIDVTDVPEDAAQRGGEAILIGDGIGVDQIAERAGTIGYEILTSLGSRYARAYIA
ncbi:alanine racemase [Terrihabitans sp. B22-R8]|uniref:alanine racemase n=1 Tax=Terrihabitans sp. B22-R8 TaxID=3425128 RepID=UPI00403CE54D